MFSFSESNYSGLGKGASLSDTALRNRENSTRSTWLCKKGFLQAHVIRFLFLIDVDPLQLLLLYFMYIWNSTENVVLLITGIVVKFQYM